MNRRALFSFLAAAPFGVVATMRGAFAAPGGKVLVGVNSYLSVEEAAAHLPRQIKITVCAPDLSSFRRPWPPGLKWPPNQSNNTARIVG